MAKNFSYEQELQARKIRKIGEELIKRADSIVEIFGNVDGMRIVIDINEPIDKSSISYSITVKPEE